MRNPGYSRSSALFVLKDKKGKIILQHRDKNIKRFPDYWGFFGSEIERGETPENAVKREAKEELSIEFKDFKFFKRYECTRENGLIEEQVVFILPLILPVKKLKQQQKEGQDLGLFSFEEWGNLKTPEFEKIIFENLFAERF